MKTLIVVDMQNDFIDGALGTKEAVEIVERVARRIEECRANGDQIIFTRDTHGENYASTQEGRKLPVEHCIKGSKGWQISDSLHIAPEDRIIDKPSFGYDWTKEGRELIKGEEIELIGLCTDICVISNAMFLKTIFPEKVISIHADCCAGVNPASHQNALDAMRTCQIEIRGEGL